MSARDLEHHPVSYAYALGWRRDSYMAYGHTFCSTCGRELVITLIERRGFDMKTGEPRSPFVRARCPTRERWWSARCHDWVDLEPPRE